FLPDERDARVEHQQQAGDDQHGGDVANEAADERAVDREPLDQRNLRYVPSHRLSADSVPPSDPGPAYVAGPRTVIGSSPSLRTRVACSATPTTTAAQPSSRLQASALNTPMWPPASIIAALHARSTGPSPRVTA